MRAIRTHTTSVHWHPTMTPASWDGGAADLDYLDRSKGGLGLHFVVRRDGRIEPHLPVNAVGRHLKTGNDTSVGVAVVGLPDNFTDAQHEAMAKLRAVLECMYPDAEHVYTEPGVEEDAGKALEAVSMDIPDTAVVSLECRVVEGDSVTAGTLQCTVSDEPTITTEVLQDEDVQKVEARPRKARR